MRWLMKKLFLLVVLTLISIQVVGLAEAATINVTCTPSVIPQPGGETTITVTSEKGGIGFIKVCQPNDVFSAASIFFLPEGGTVSKVYPDDFISRHITIIVIRAGELDSPPKVAERMKERLTLLLQSFIEQQSIAQTGSTQQTGKYEVKVSLLGQVQFDKFQVLPFFFVIPESPIGTIGGLTAAFVALILMIHLYLRKWRPIKS